MNLTIGNIKPNIQVQIKGLIKDVQIVSISNQNKVYKFILEDYTDQIECKFFVSHEETSSSICNNIKRGSRIRVTGKSLWDGYLDKFSFIVESMENE